MAILAERKEQPIEEDELQQAENDLAKWERLAVRRGARLLDEVIIKWWLKIDLDDFTLDSTYQDILGQLYGGYHNGLDTLRLSYVTAPGFGFDSAIVEYDCGLEASISRLEKYWLEEIKERFSKCR